MNGSVLKLDDAQVSKLVGGKAKSLGEMIRAGFKVPNGFVVTTESNMQMTKALESEILEKFDGLGAKFVAVRSSATSEDSKDAAWAGQFDTFLNITRKNLVKNIKKCWDSADSARAKAYAKEKGLKSGLVAVVVQQMIDSDISGVAFSVHPVTKNSQHMVVEAIFGLLDALVSGQVTPSTYILDKNTGKTIESNLTDNQPILKSQQIKELIQTVKKIEEYFGFPVDVEWTFAQGKLFILQSRPITTLN